jgi:hypothetical protein
MKLSCPLQPVASLIAFCKGDKLLCEPLLVTGKTRSDLEEAEETAGFEINKDLSNFSNLGGMVIILGCLFLQFHRGAHLEVANLILKETKMGKSEHLPPALRSQL